MQITRDQIARFFNQTCTAEEAVAVSEFLKENPDAANEWLPAGEWEAAAGGAGKPAAYWDDVWREVKPARTTKMRSLFIRLGAAAVLAGAIAAGWYWLGTDTPSGNSPVAASGQFRGKEIGHSGKGVMRYVMEDGSVAELSPGGYMRYDPAFPGNRRDVEMNGTIVFHTSGDAARPFTVYCNGLAVTALGTAFRVDNGTDGRTSVLLMEGKVAVKAADTALVKLDQDYILQPGDEFSYSPGNGMALLRKQPARKQPAKAAAQNEADNAVNNWYMFDNQGLPQVFDQLAAIYNVRIYYKPADLKGLNFIGRIDGTDTLGNVLNDIATLNNLRIIKSGNEYVISVK